MSLSMIQRQDDERWKLIVQNLKEDLASDDDAQPTAPTPWEALRVKYLLGVFFLPIELIDLIMDLAEYWPCTYSSMGKSVAVLNDDKATLMDFYSVMFTYHHWVPEAVTSKVLLSTDPMGYQCPVLKNGGKMPWARLSIPKSALKYGDPHKSHYTKLPTRGSRPCRKIVFSIVSREETAKTTPIATWFEAAIGRAGPDRKLPVLHPKTPEREADEEGDRTSKHISKPKKAQRNMFHSMQSLWQKEPWNRKKPPEEITPSQLKWHTVCRNEQARSLNRRHVREWRYEHTNEEVEESDRGLLSSSCAGANLVRSIEVGDSIILRARTSNSSSPTMNYVVSASVAIYWAV